MQTIHGAGSVYRRTSDKRWVAVVDLPRGRGEKRRRRTVTSFSRATVELWLAAYRAEHPIDPPLGRARHMEQARLLGTHTAGEWWRLVRRVQGACNYCETRHPGFQMDHKIPVSRGGSDAIENITVACPGCNAEKGTMTAAEYVAWKREQ